MRSTWLWGIAGLTVGKKVTFELVRGQKIEARVRAVVPEENVRTHTRMVRFKPNFKIRPENLAANQSATVYLPIGKSRTVLSVHKDALTSSRGVPTVFVVESRRAYARQIVEERGHRCLPSQTNFIFFHLGQNIRPFRAAMEQRGILVGRPFPPFMDWCRLSIGTMEEMHAFATAFEAEMSRP